MIRICSLTTRFRVRQNPKSPLILKEHPPTLSPIYYTMLAQYHPRDPNTLSNYHEFLTVHTKANLSIDFDQKKIYGNVVLNLRDVSKTKSTKIILDTSYVKVQAVKINGEFSEWNLLPRSEPYGSPLEIGLASSIQPSQLIEVDVSKQAFVLRTRD